MYQQAWLQINDSIEYPVELSENINAIAFKVINDRMFRELGNTILRVAVKKAIENKVRDKDKNLGFLVGLVNTATEKADTRNWQTLPFFRFLQPDFVTGRKPSANLKYNGR